MNSICLSTDQLTAALPVLGLDVVKKSVQAELRTNGKRVRFGFENNAKGFAQLAACSKSRVRQKFGRAWKPPDPTVVPLRCGSMAKAIASACLIRDESNSMLAALAIGTKPICWMPLLLPILFALICLQHGNRLLWKWRSSKPWCVGVKNSPSCCRPKRTAWKESLLMCAALWSASSIHSARRKHAWKSSSPSRSVLTSNSPAIINCSAPLKESARSLPPACLPRWHDPVKSSAPARLPLMPVWLRDANKAAPPCVATEV